MKRLALLAAVLLVVGCDRTITINEPSPPPTPTTTPTPPPTPPVIAYFAADSPQLAFGGSTILRWDVTGDNVLVRVDPAPGDVPATGATIIVATNVGPLFYILTARNAAGTSQRTLTIRVN